MHRDSDKQGLRRPENSFPSRNAPEHEPKIRVLVVNDDVLVRAGLRAVLPRTPGMRVVGEAATGDEAAALAERLHPDVLLLEVRPWDHRTITLCSEVVRTCRAGRLMVIVYQNGHESRTQAATEQGLGDRCPSVEPLELAHAILTVAEGGLVRTAVLTGESMAQVDRVGLVQPEKLTAREERILAVAKHRRTYKEIASTTGLSTVTAKASLGHIYKKIRVAVRAEVAVFSTSGCEIARFPAIHRHSREHVDRRCWYGHDSYWGP